MSYSSLKHFLSQNRDLIIQQMKEALSRAPWCPYQEFVLRTEEGQQRLHIWTDTAIRALEGEREALLKNAEEVGYLRAVQGFSMNFSSHIYLSFGRIISEMLEAEAHRNGLNLLDTWKGFHELNEILLKGFSTVATSFLRTREEMIQEKVNHLQEIYDFTREIITLLDLDAILKLMIYKIKACFKIEESFVFFRRNASNERLHVYPVLERDFSDIMDILEKVMKERRSFSMNDSGQLSTDFSLPYRIVTVFIPVQTHGRCYGVLTIFDRKQGFELTGKELDLLNQFIYIFAVALENTFALEEIEQRRQELQVLTGKLITIQEEERKRLATDIHNTIAQTLTGISYKIQVCKELVKKNPQMLVDHLDELIKSANQAIDYSKEMITRLRPALIDTMGLLPALVMYIESFVRETGISVKKHLPPRLKLPSELNICLFRIAQEALMNIHKHAGVKSAEIFLKKKNGIVSLIMADEGKGFDLSKGNPWLKNPDKLGLLSIKERMESVGGTLTIHSGINRGCKIEVKIPLHQQN